MTNRTATYVIGGMAAAVAIILLVMLAAWSFRGDGDAGSIEANGSFLHPQVRQEARAGYVIAELYQDVRLDVQSGVYDRDGALRGSHWTHDDVAQTCSIDLVLAVQEGKDQAPPTATPRPPEPTATPGPVHVLPAVYAVDSAGAATVLQPDRTVVAMPTATPTGWPGPTPYPTATPSPLIASVSWIGWAGRAVAIEADGFAVLNAPRDADVSAHLSVWTGAHQTGQTRLARLPLPEPEWSEGQAHIRLQKASGRILLNRDHIDAHHRSARLSIEAAPLSDCHGLNLRWQRAAAVVVRALTQQPYADWQDHQLPPTPAPSPATLRGLTLTGVALDPAFATDEMNYTASVPHALGETTVRPALADQDETYTISLDGAPQSANEPAVVPLSPGSNVVAVVVTSADTNTSETYTVTVTRAIPSADATLASLALGGTSPDEWTPVFATDVYDYDVRVPHSTVRTAVGPHTSHTAATFAVSTNPPEALTDSGYGTALVELPEGATTTVTVTVTAEDGATTQAYEVRVHRAAP